nr:polynucleotidyl transferase, ribonuclease H-like superfamily protein [Tanacetum cinerariifolium]
RGRLLGITVVADCFWAYRVGVVVSDANNEVASPYCVMERKKANGYNQMMASSFQDMIKKISVSGIIIGLCKDPRKIKGTSRLIRDPSGFVDYLSKNLELVPYTYCEEEFLLIKVHFCLLYFQTPTPALDNHNDVLDDDEDEPLTENDDDDVDVLDKIEEGEELNVDHLVLAQF